MAKLVAYTRVSSELQEDNTSLEFQLKRIEAYCVAQGYTLVAHKQDVETASGKRERPGFLSALELVYAGDADGIICMKLDRFARNTIEGLQVAAELKKRGKQLVILDLNLDTNTPVGECVFSILLAFAQLEREIIRERTLNGRKVKEERGEYAHGQPPYGWIAVDKQLVEDPIEQTVRRLIFRWNAEGKSNRTIAERLNYWQIPSKRGGRWSCGVIYEMVNRRHRKLERLLQKAEERNDGDYHKAS